MPRNARKPFYFENARDRAPTPLFDCLPGNLQPFSERRSASGFRDGFGKCFACVHARDESMTCFLAQASLA